MCMPSLSAKNASHKRAFECEEAYALFLVTILAVILSYNPDTTIFACKQLDLHGQD